MVVRLRAGGERATRGQGMKNGDCSPEVVENKEPHIDKMSHALRNY
jgi:hypothetical protein